jgi:hypothetical protein
MTVTEAVQAALVDPSTGITGLVPADRIRVPGDWQNLKRPYVIHQPVSEAEPLHTYGAGRSPIRDWTFYQVSVFSDDYATGEELADPIIAALDGYHSAVLILFHGGPGYVGFEADTRVHHFAHDFRILAALPEVSP